MLDIDTLRAMPIEVAAPLEAGYRLWQSGQLDAAYGQLQMALARAEAARSAAGLLGAHQLLGGLTHSRGDLAAAWVHHSYVLRRSRALGLRIGVASALHNLGLIAGQRGDPLVAGALLDAAAATYEELGQSGGAALVRANLAQILGGPAACA